jgi:hypothetical protein
MSLNHELTHFNSYEQKYEKIESLQPYLSSLVDQASEIYENILPHVPSALDAPVDAPLFHTTTMSAYDGKLESRSILMNYGNDNTIVIEKYMGDNLRKPVWTIDHTFPYDETYVKRVQVMKYDKNSLPNFEYEIDISVCDRETWQTIRTPEEMPPDELQIIEQTSDQLLRIP